MTRRAQDDFYDYVNGEWLETAKIPEDKPSTGGFQDLVTSIETQLMTQFETWAAQPESIPNTYLKTAIDYYELAMDQDRRNVLAAKPLAEHLSILKTIDSFEALNDVLYELSLKNFALPFDLDVMADMKNTQQHALYLSPASLILPDKTYYAEENEQTTAMLQEFFDMSVTLMQELGHTRAQSEALVEQAMAYDKALVDYVKSAEERADYSLMYNPRSMDQVAAYTDRFDLKTLIEKLVAETVETVIVTEPTYFEHFSAFTETDHLPLLRSWMYVMTALRYTEYLSNDIRVLGGRYQRFLSGIKEAKTFEKAAYQTAFSQFSAAVGEYYAKTYFGPEAKADVEHMVATMIDVYKKRLEQNNWLSDDTRTLAIKKLDHIGVHVGYPEKLPKIYDSLHVTAKADGGEFFENVLALARIRTLAHFEKYSEPVDRTEWGMSAATVNAYYSGLMNIIVFPAAILQAPFYSLSQSSSANYGGIGAVIAHEISHAFDNNGAKFDENGNLSNWWTTEDLAQFKALANQMIAEFDGLDFAEGKVNGTLTVSENIADAGGLSCALEAAKRESDVDLEDFFVNWAKIWRTKATLAYQQLLLKVDVHGPAKLRANIQVQNLDDFYDVFDVQPTDPMYRAPEERVHIW
ncbi:M13 family metallopeptidase [uncultured Enterococcus sp.]|uniref:M13 family metallopeptidase n=1 Tax=uncultured Enterococcus sp. TaxID=167972 RepID=UPI0025FC967B|nr:M13-type metalloendopeptidase [uncultured Enterococcus sp.]